MRRTKKKGVPLNDAASQYERMLDACPGPVDIDGRTFSQFLHFAVQFGSLVRFYDLNDRPDGDWTPFFLTDPTMILASIESLNLHSLEDQFLHLLLEAREARRQGRKLELLSECFQVIYRMARRVEAWLGGAQTNPRSRAARLFVGETANLIDTSLSGQLAQLKTYAESMRTAGTIELPLDLDFQVFGSLWRSIPAPDAPVPESRGNHAKSKNLDQLISLLEEIFCAFLDAFRRLQEFAAKHLPETLEDRNHKPQIALYIAFVRLFQTAQQTLNTVTQRFTYFYYHDVLREKEAGPAPDSVYLTFTLDPASGLVAATVPKGAQFPAGKEPDGSSILYAADATTSVTTATLQALRGLRVIAGPLYETPLLSPPSGWDDFLTPASPPAPEAALFVLGTEIDLKVMNDEAAGKPPPGADAQGGGLAPWPPFGAAAPGVTAISSTAPVTLGFAIASPYLMLTGGNRTVRLVFTLTPETARDLDSNLEDLAYATGLSTAQIFQQLVGQAFDLWLSTTDGWFQVAAYSCSAVTGQHPAAFTLLFTLDPSAPPVVAFNPPPKAPPPAAPPKPDNLNPAPELPTLKAYLKQNPVLLDGPNGEVTAWPLSLLAGLCTRGIEVRTSTVNLTDLQISGITGPVDSSAPWPVFGAIPVTGAFLDFGNPELFVKTPDPGSLKISLTWFGLPPTPTGFAGYYQGYIVGPDDQPLPAAFFDNQTFRGELRVVNPGTWDIGNAEFPELLSPPDPSFVYLFRTTGDCSNPVPSPDGTLCPVTNFESLDVVDTAAPQFYEPAASAIRLTLTEPPYAFGNALYAPNVLNSVVSELPKPHLETGLPPGCAPLSDAAASLAACQSANGQPPPSRQQIEQIAAQTQERLIQAAQGSLSRSLAPYGEEVASWIQDTFTVYGPQAAPYRAQNIRGRLQASLASIGQSSRPAPVSPPSLPLPAAVPIRRSIAMLQAVIMIQQSLEHCAAEDDASWQSCIQPQIAACRQKLLQACAECLEKSQPLPYPNPPWLPQARSVSLSYDAHTRISTFFHILPWGGYEAVSWSGSALPVLPVPARASLELGFSGLDAPQSIDLLIQMTAGSEAAPPQVSWQHLDSNTWVPFDEAQIPADTTNGLQNTGIVSFNLPAAGAAPSTIVSSDYRWLRAITARPEGFPNAIGIYPHPITATWVNDGTGSGEHLAQPVPPYTIKSSLQTLPGVKTIDQPIESFGGRPAENTQTFRARLSERLRHKGRAVLPWDYERLVLETFPSIWKVKAIPAAGANGALKPGRVLVTVVAGAGGVQVADPTAPLASADMLEQIRASLSSIASPFACLQVTNPVYVRIHVTAEVIFQDTPEGGGGIDVLNSQLVGYLSPWFYDAERASLKGHYASEDAITQFIQTRPWVASLVNIGFEYEPSPANLRWYFLTSAKSHSITQADAISNSKGIPDPCSRS